MRSKYYFYASVYWVQIANLDYTNRKEAVDIQNEMNETQKEL